MIHPNFIQQLRIPTPFFQVSRLANTQFSSVDYQYLQKSSIPTYHFQKSLPRLPIPKLADSCCRYLNAVKAVSSDDEFKNAEKVVADFLVKEGPDLQKELISYDKQHKDTSYISEAWFDMYLSSRVPCPINFNPFMMYAPDPDQAFNDQLSRATNFAISFGRFKKSLDAGLLAPEVFHMNPKKSDTDLFRTFCRLLPSALSWYGAFAFKAFPLDMSQYSSLFGGNRIPMKEKDRLHLNNKSKFFLVVFNGNFYTVDLYDQNGNLHPPSLIHRCLGEILNSSFVPDSDACPGSLTTLDRNTWADVREELLSSDINNQSISKIDDSLFALCLDSFKSADPSRLIESLLCGDDGRNRWFDKCFQLIVDGNGQATINFEHSWGDGVAVLRLLEDTFRDTNLNHFVHPGQEPDSAIDYSKYMQKLKWTLTDSIKRRIRTTQQRHAVNSQRLNFGTVQYAHLTRDKIKERKLSPDAIMQLAIQLAFYSQYKEFAPTYESSSTAAYRKGRTECVRSATIATKDVVLAMQKGPSNKEDLVSLFQKASCVHYELCKEAAMGQGFDRHFFGLKIAAQRLGRPIPQLFADPVFQKMNHFVLSTSTLTTDTIVFGGFGPVVEDGFGIGYNVNSNYLGAVVTANKDKRDAKRFCESLIESLDRIKSVLN